MAQTTGKLTALKAQRLAEPGMHADGGGLYLQVSGKGAKSWVFRFMIAGRARAMGLGSFSGLSLADARIKAAECRGLRNEGLDPITAREAERLEGKVAAAKAVTFGKAAGGRGYHLAETALLASTSLPVAAGTLAAIHP